MKYFHYIFIVFLFISCTTSDDSTIPEDPNIPEGALYFPSIEGNDWATVTPSSLNWNENKLEELYTYLDEKNTKGFIILKDGKIAAERYFNGHSQNTKWEWYSAAKSLTAFAIGTAQDDGFININNKTSDYLGNNWSSLDQNKQDLITVKHHLTMTTSLVSNQNDFLAWSCTLPNCMDYLSDAGSVWSYHQGAFILLQNMISQSVGSNFKPYIKDRILDRIGMQGSWSTLLFLNIFKSDTRSMARFGLLSLNEGKWNNDVILSPNYFNSMTNTSQNLNKAYGYLWWLNGKESFVGTNSEIHLGSIIPNAPNDMFAALGANDQKIYVIPSKNMVIIRCGESAGLEELASSGFDNELWAKINQVIN